MFRSYRAFATNFYKFFICVIYPVFAIFCCVLVQSGCFGLLNKSGYHFLVPASMLGSCMIFVECMADYWLFCGIQSKSANHMNFLKSSRKGIAFFKNALLGDVLRRFLVIVGCSIINAIIGVYVFKYDLGGTYGICLVAVYAFYSYFLSTLAVFVCRFGTIWYFNMGVGYLGSSITAILTLLISRDLLPIWVWVLLYLIASIVISIIAVKVAIKKVEDSYHDQRC